MITPQTQAESAIAPETTTSATMLANNVPSAARATSSLSSRLDPDT
jgi:hypothetical protein